MTYAKLNLDAIRQFGSVDDSISMAPVGTTLPTALLAADAALPAPWIEVGWNSEDGYTFSPNDSTDKRKGHQGHEIYKTIMTESNTEFSFVALETSLTTFSIQWDIKKSEDLAAGGGPGKPATQLTLSSARSIKSVALAVRTWSEGYQYMYLIPRFEIGERSEYKLSATEDTAFNVKGTIIGNVTLITDDPAIKNGLKL